MGGTGNHAVAPVPLSEREQSLPAGRVLKVIYRSMPPAPAQLAGPLRMQVGVYARRASDKSYRPLIDGDELASQADRYWIGVRPLTDGYLYVIQVDTRGNADWLFPANGLSASSGNNPVKGEQSVQVPPGKSLYLDQNTGIERLYVVLSATRWPELEEALIAPAPPTTAVPPTFADSGLPPVGRTRGVGGVASDDGAASFERVTEGTREQLTLSAQTFRGNGPLLVVERWFRHVER
jgi:hypothetical protein